MRGPWPRGRSSPTAWSVSPASVISPTSATAAARGLRFDLAAARHAIDFFGFLRHSKGEWAGQTFALAPWQAFVVGCLFGWQRSDGLRRFRTAYCAVPRKNGKSTLSAGIALYLLVADGEQGAEIYSAATTRDQARIVFDEAKRMVQSSPALRRRVARADQQPERRGQRLALHAAVLRCQLHGRPERAWRDHRRAARAQDPPRGRRARDRDRRPPPAAPVRDHHRRLRPPLDLLRAPRLLDQGAGRRPSGRQLVRLHRRRRRGRRLDRSQRSGRRPTRASGSRSRRTISRARPRRRSRCPAPRTPSGACT